ncbi:hypothetical protein COY27_05780 [Candidatus Woesearchaeota archaeon CG_4_10_14_0_2_um_filter_33_13]|nr:MAG: hypothetical protein COY27_05780 [Candidatus Woesearchaeota archaeon CG_4_10_14_0_2_um_filter_33_13]
MSIDNCVNGNCNFKPKALVIDDDHTQLDLSKLFFSYLGFSVDTVDDPAKIGAEVHDYDAVISDTFGAGWYGPREVVSRLKELNYRGVVLGNSSTPNPDVERDWQVSGHSFVVKPMGMEGYKAQKTLLKQLIGCHCNPTNYKF